CNRCSIYAKPIPVAQFSDGDVVSSWKQNWIFTRLWLAAYVRRIPQRSEHIPILIRVVRGNDPQRRCIREGLLQITTSLRAVREPPLREGRPPFRRPLELCSRCSVDAEPISVAQFSDGVTPRSGNTTGIHLRRILQRSERIPFLVGAVREPPATMVRQRERLRASDVVAGCSRTTPARNKTMRRGKFDAA